MKRSLILLTLLGAAFPALAQAAEIDWKKVDAALGKTAAVSGEVHRYGLPRSDLHVTLDGIAIKPALALGGWVAFAPMHDQAMVMGDLVLLETEINPVMTKLLEGGLDITAIHNHILRASPATFYMHVGGLGDPGEDGDRDSFGACGQQNAVRCAGHHRRPAPAIDLDTAKLDQIMGVKGNADRRRLSIRRAAPRSRHGKRNEGDRRRSAAPTRSISSRPATARPPSPAISW